MTTTFRTHFTFRVDTWTPEGESIVEQVKQPPETLRNLAKQVVDGSRHENPAEQRMAGSREPS